MSAISQAYIVDAVRTPVGRRKGGLSGVHSADLGAHLPNALMDRPGVTIDRQCGPSQQAVHFAAQAVMSGLSGLVVAGGVQNMSQIPLTAAALVGDQFGHPAPYSGPAAGASGTATRPSASSTPPS